MTKDYRNNRLLTIRVFGFNAGESSTPLKQFRVDLTSELMEFSSTLRKINDTRFRQEIAENIISKCSFYKNLDKDEKKKLISSLCEGSKEDLDNLLYKLVNKTNLEDLNNIPDQIQEQFRKQVVVSVENNAQGEFGINYDLLLMIPKTDYEKLVQAAVTKKNGDFLMHMRDQEGLDYRGFKNPSNKTERLAVMYALFYEHPGSDQFFDRNKQQIELIEQNLLGILHDFPEKQRNKAILNAYSYAKDRDNVEVMLLLRQQNDFKPIIEAKYAEDFQPHILLKCLSEIPKSRRDDVMLKAYEHAKTNGDDEVMALLRQQDNFKVLLMNKYPDDFPAKEPQIEITSSLSEPVPPESHATEVPKPAGKVLSTPKLEEPESARFQTVESSKIPKADPSQKHGSVPQSPASEPKPTLYTPVQPITREDSKRCHSFKDELHKGEPHKYFSEAQEERISARIKKLEEGKVKSPFFKDRKQAKIEALKELLVLVKENRMEISAAVEQVKAHYPEVKKGVFQNHTLKLLDDLQKSAGGDVETHTHTQSRSLR